MMLKHITTFLIVALVSASGTRASAYDYGKAGPFKLQPTTNVQCLVAPGQPLPPQCALPAVPENGSPKAQAAAYIARGWQQYRRIRFEKAGKEFRSAARVDSSFETQLIVARYELSMVQMYRSPEFFENAERYLDKAESLAPDNLDVRSTRASLLYHQLRSSDAIDILDSVIKTDDTHLFAREMRAQIHLGKARHKQALADYNMLILLAPDNAFWRRARGNIYLDLGRNKDAVAEFSDFIAMNPLDRDAYELRAVAYARTGNAAPGLKDLTVILDGFKDGTTFALGSEKRAELLTRRSFLFLSLKQHKPAVTDALEAVSIGGKPKILKLQVFLKKRGFAVKIDGKVSNAMRTAIQDCFGMDQCVAQIFRQI